MKGLGWPVIVVDRWMSVSAGLLEHIARANVPLHLT